MSDSRKTRDPAPPPSTGEWMIGMARRNPEALLVLAAGAALLMRGGSHVLGHTYSEDGWSGRSVDAVQRAARTASDYAEEGARRLSREAGRARRSGVRLGRRATTELTDQPLAMVALGLAAGAAAATLLPRSAFEDRTLAPARHALAEAAGEAAGAVREAVGETGTRLREGATDGLKDIAQDAADTLVDSVIGKAGDGGGANAEGRSAGNQGGMGPQSG